MDIKKSLYEYDGSSCNDAYFLRRKEYKWYDKCFSKVVEDFTHIIIENEKLPNEVLSALKKLNKPTLVMMISNKRLELIKQEGDSIKKEFDKINEHIEDKKLYLDDKEFISNYENYITCFNQYVTLNRLEYLSQQIKNVCLKEKDNGNLYELADRIETYLAEEEYKNYNFAPIEIFTIAPIEGEMANALFQELYQEINNCREIEKKLKTNNPKQ